MSLPNDTMLTATEAAKLLGISEAAIRKRIKTGKLHAIKEGHTWKISAADIEDNRTVPNRTSEPHRTVPFLHFGVLWAHDVPYRTVPPLRGPLAP